ncbi:hypothetical protein AB835_10815 [Candidatus Endobugula sertula]|uniref:Uncharacterized protein n=1 Tax=Candidatus Endobugula sertula TaxID=62101 RepID=A0A1D2QN97_9GAMM|nr:hypothetical protein AB835_10815 [Candidatus Endobugula sertula]
MADHLRVILKAIEDRKHYAAPEYLLPIDFRLSDSSIATVINCTLDLEMDNMLSAENVKRSRQHIREKQQMK